MYIFSLNISRKDALILDLVAISRQHTAETEERGRSTEQSQSPGLDPEKTITNGDINGTAHADADDEPSGKDRPFTPEELTEALAEVAQKP